MTVTKKGKFYNKIVSLFSLFLPYLLIFTTKYVINKYDLSIILIIFLISIDFIICLIFLIFVIGIGDESFIFDIEYFDDSLFLLKKNKKSIEILYDNFIMNNIHIYRYEINLFTKENKIRIKMKENNIINLKMILKRLGNKKFESIFEENINILCKSK